MNKILVDLQRNSKAVCAVVLDKDYKDLGQGVVMDANISDGLLFGSVDKNPIFKEQLEKKSKDNELTYFVIRNIDKLDSNEQNKFVALVKDREFEGYYLPYNVIVVFTVESEESVKKISNDLYHFCVVAI